MKFFFPKDIKKDLGIKDWSEIQLDEPEEDEPGTSIFKLTKYW